MATTLVVPVCRIGKVREHQNASMLGVAEVLGYQVVTGLVEDPNGAIPRWFLKDKRDEKGKRIPVQQEWAMGSGLALVYWLTDKDGNRSKVGFDDVEKVGYSFAQKEGDLVVYIPADVVLPEEWAVKLGVKGLLKGGNRVGKISLRGEPSYGIVTAIPEDKRGVWQEGDNVAGHYGATKWEPPVKARSGDAAAYDPDIDPYFDKFTDVQNGRIFVHVFGPGEEVVASEKIHGTNCRVGIVNGREVAGSMELRRKRPTKTVDPENGSPSFVVDLPADDPEFKRSTYWFPWSIPGVQRLLADVSTASCGVLGLDSPPVCVEVFGEVYGNSVQAGFKYDAFGELKFRAFGLKVNDRFIDWGIFESLCSSYGIPVVPVSYRGPFDMARIVALSDSPSEIGGTPVVDGIHIREGVVVVPARERTDPKVGRAILKYIGYKYDMLKNRPDCKDV